MILHNGVLPSRPDADALAVEGARIIAVGSEASVSASRPEDEERLDLRGRAVLPGFVDAHLHIFHTGLAAIGWRVDLTGRSREGVLERLSAAAAERGTSAWTIGTGWDESDWPDGGYLQRRDLDRLSTTSPIGAVRIDGHLLVVNTEGLRLASEMLPEALRGPLVDSDSGQIREEASWEILRSIRPDETVLSDAFAAAAAQCHRLGVTSVHTMTQPAWVPVLISAGDRNRLRVAVYQHVSSPDEVDRLLAPDRFDGTWIRFGGVKAFADGSLGAKNAAVSVPYTDGGSGALNHTDEAIAEIVSRAEARGWQTAIHAIGDRAIEQVLQTHVSVGSSPERRHRIEHLELASRSQIERARDLGLHLSMQPNFIGNWSGPGSMNERRVGRDRDELSDPLRSVLDAGAPLAFGSDGMPVAPIYGLDSAVNGPYAVQRVTVDEAIACYTEGGARFSFEEGIKGCLEVGAYADLVVLDEDPRRDPARLGERRVECVYVAGRCVYAEEV